MFVSNEIPDTFNKVAEITSNYIVLVENQQLASGVDYEAYFQFFYPSVLVIHLEDYRIKTGDIVEYSYSTGASGELVSSEVSYKLNTFSLEETSTDFYDRPDAPLILWTQFLFVILFVWVLNQCSKFFKKGGVFTS